MDTWPSSTLSPEAKSPSIDTESISDETAILQLPFSNMINLDNFEEHRDENGLDFIHNFIKNQKLNDYLNAAVENHDDLENEKNQENVDPNFRYV